MLKKFVLLAALVVSLVGCASVPMGDTRKDSTLKSFKGKPDLAGVYIYRNETLGGAIRMDVEVDGKPLGQTAAKTYFYTELAPGKHLITSKSENSDTLEINALPGKLYYIWQEVKMGVLYARTKLHLIDDAEGQRGVLETQLAASR